MSIPLRKAAVIGGGFSGMSAAIELARRDVQVDLIESDAGWRSYGAGISLGGATLRALRTLGILDDFLREGAASDGVDLRAPHGAPIGELPTPRVAGPDVPGGGAILRPTLAKIMSQATRRAGVEVRLGCSFATLAQDAEGCEVVCADGQRERYDLVVGADGLHSAVRAQLFPEAPQPAYAGQGVWRAVLPRPAEITRCRMWMGGATKPGVNPVSATQMYLFVTEHRPRNERIPPEQQPAMLRELLAPFPDPLLQALRAQIDEHAQVIYRPLESLLLPRPWHRGRAVLIGDAVHATTPHLASGACIGIEDGIVLAEELGRAESVEAGLAAFQARRWERCRMVVENSGRLGAIEIAHGDKAEHAQLMRESLVALAEPI
ncbi:MAG TPA: FAD-dependent oxidoreductase [Methylibium sp.]|uniref:FAD-dependent oxidoreductase n=1 Tax=Methylibium sp. TaxID=2067992 RepID=UPI002DBD71F6|nr:FAD-dependent oxidoreductase [Methylibium sp.]HEU4460046.1 FAD-dependent oxidoreductase [Methylibium sp.]